MTLAAADGAGLPSPLPRPGEGPPPAELVQMRQSMHDLVTLLALPALWGGRSPLATLSLALDTLASLVRLDVIYARLTPQEGHCEEAVHLGETASADVVAAVREGMGAALDHPGLGACDLPGLGRTGLLVAPLGFYGGTGLIAFGASRPGFPAPAEAMLLRAAANLVATAVESARLLDETKAARNRASFLAQVSEGLSASPQEAAALVATAARIAVERVAEACAVDLLESATGSIATAVVESSLPVRLAEVRRQQGSIAVQEAVARVIQSGGAQLQLVSGGASAQRMAAIAPIVAAGVVIGAVSLFLDSGRLAFGAADLEMAGDFGRRLGVALEVARLAREAREADHRKDEFLAMLAHELRNPLAPILTALQLLQLRGGVAGREQQIIERQVRHMVRLVDDLLDVSRISRGKVELKPESLLVRDVLDRAAEVAHPLIAQHGHHLTVSVEPASARVLGDAVRLAQIFGNLLTNAAKYSLAGARISVVATCADGVNRIAVRDSGIGIAAGLLPKVFDLFVQGERGLDRSQGGLGIGLALVRSLVERHGGSVTARSEGAGLGSEFVVLLPEAAGVKLPEIPVALLKSGKSPTRLLVVDDNVDAADLLAEVLRSFGHEVAVANDGPQALALAQELLPTTAVVDIGLPLMDGYELAQRLRLVPGLAGMRLVALSGYGQSSDKDRSKAAGFDAHLVKPADLETILGAIWAKEPARPA